MTPIEAIKNVIIYIFNELFAAVIRPFFKGFILSNIDHMFDSVSNSVTSISGDLNAVPSSWNASVFDFIMKVSNTVILPLSGMVISFVLSYELVNTVSERNNFRDIDAAWFAKFYFKACIAVLLLTKTSEFTMAIFDVGAYVVNGASGIVPGASAISTDAWKTSFEAQYDSLTTIEVIGMFIETFILQLVMWAVGWYIKVIVIVRMMMIYIHISVAPLPFATFMNKEVGTIGTNYYKGLIGLAFQAFFMLLCVGIYSVLVASVSTSTDFKTGIFEVFIGAIALVLALQKSETIAKSIFGAH